MFDGSNQKPAEATDSRAANLEGEVTQMRQEVKSLRELLGNNSKETVSGPNLHVS